MNRDIEILNELNDLELRLFIGYCKVLQWHERLKLAFQARHEKERHYHWIGENVNRARAWLATYPERQKFIFHISKYRVYIWLSIDMSEKETISP